jgi:hypothetical protein
MYKLRPNENTEWQNQINCHRGQLKARDFHKLMLMVRNSTKHPKKIYWHAKKGVFLFITKLCGQASSLY